MVKGFSLETLLDSFSFHPSLFLWPNQRRSEPPRVGVYRALCFLWLFRRDLQDGEGTWGERIGRLVKESEEGPDVKGFFKNFVHCIIWWTLRISADSRLIKFSPAMSTTCMSHRADHLVDHLLTISEWLRLARARHVKDFRWHHHGVRCSLEPVVSQKVGKKKIWFGWLSSDDYIDKINPVDIKPCPVCKVINRHRHAKNTKLLSWKRSNFLLPL